VNVLVAHASKHGSTAEIADAIAAELRERGLTAESASVDDVAGLDGYDAVILGSAVYMKRWRGDGRRFLRKHGKQLAAMPFWVFSSGPVGDPAKDNPSWQEPKRTIARAEKLGARDHVVFGGSMPKEPRGRAQKSMVEGTPPEYRDRRDWGRIRGWAADVAEALGAPPAAP